MTAGRMIAVVGPSGVGKDSVMEGIKAASAQPVHLVRRVITRPEDQIGEDYDAVTETAFEELVRNKAFSVHWRSHGLRYGIPITVKYHLGRGAICLANFSRSALEDAARVFPNLAVLNLTALPQTLALRLASRGRESAQEIADRLAQATKPLPPGLEVVELSNDGPLSETVAQALHVLKPQQVR